MITKRIIPCLDVKDGKTVKGVHFKSLKEVGDPAEMAKLYDAQGADELVFLDISATIEGRRTMTKVVEDVARSISIPFTTGGGISSMDDIQRLLRAGADKVSLNSAAVRHPDLLHEGAMYFGSQCIVLALDAKQCGENKWTVVIDGGRTDTELDAIAWAKEAVSLGAGEILLTSMDKDGTKDGFDLALTKAVHDAVQVPVIASGGCGKKEDFLALFARDAADAALAASLFHYGEMTVQEVKAYLSEHGIEVRL